MHVRQWLAMVSVLIVSVLLPAWSRASWAGGYPPTAAARAGGVARAQPGDSSAVAPVSVDVATRTEMPAISDRENECQRWAYRMSTRRPESATPCDADCDSAGGPRARFAPARLAAVASPPSPASTASEVIAPILTSASPTSTPTPTVSSRKRMGMPMRLVEMETPVRRASPAPEELTREDLSLADLRRTTPTPTPGPTPDGVRRRVRVPILMYHHVAMPPPNADRIRYDLSVPPDRFEAHLRYLRNAGYTTITLDDLLYYLTQGRPLPPKPLIITFDDGYRDTYTNAFPLLRAYGFTATFFIITDLVNQGHPDYLTWDMVREMKKAGMWFGAHGRTHMDLAKASHDQLVWQALGSTEVFQVELGEPARYIAYPSGAYDDEVIAVYRSAHYWAGLTTHQGMTQDSRRLFELPRLRVRHDTSVRKLAKILASRW